MAGTRSIAVAAPPECKHGDGNALFSRGVCQSCFSDAMELKKTGQATDDDLVELKLLAPMKQLGRKVKNESRFVRSKESALLKKFRRIKARKKRTS